jgi:hypothetical protein
LINSHDQPLLKRDMRLYPEITKKGTFYAVK